MHNQSPGLFSLLLKDSFSNLTSIREVMEWPSGEVEGELFLSPSPGEREESRKRGDKGLAKQLIEKMLVDRMQIIMGLSLEILFT